MIQIEREDIVKLQLYKQYLFQSPAVATYSDMLTIMHNLGYVQLDTIHVICRSHDLFFWSRMGQGYQPHWFNQAYIDKEVFEHYLYALVILPHDVYPLIKHRLTHFKEKTFTEESRSFLLDLYKQVKEKGELTSLDIPVERTVRKTWEVSPVQRGLNQLWRSGLVGVRRGNNFTKLYTELENTIPSSALDSPALDEQAFVHHFVGKAFDNLGVATEREIRDCFTLPRKLVHQTLVQLLEQEKVMKVEVVGEADPHYMKSEDYERLSNELAGKSPSHCTFLTPFDNMIRDRNRVLKLFSVDYKLESYLPAGQRTYGYFGLPILIENRIVGVIDLKLDRKRNCLLVKKLTLFYESEKGTHLEQIKPILKSMCLFLQAHEVKVEAELEPEYKNELTMLC